MKGKHRRRTDWILWLWAFSQVCRDLLNRVALGLQLVLGLGMAFVLGLGLAYVISKIGGGP